ncbi:MAG: flagellar basal body L-ring protein FlgH [Magnetococcales bacterium]|nr:flagellar basal body L-ring protein FlgH [Magnetococcales bacterium]
MDQHGWRRMTLVATAALVTAASMSGCGMTRAAQRPPAPVTVVQPQPPELLMPKKGSIWQTSDRNTLFLDNKARNIGDIVVVRITEKASALNNAETNLERKSTDSTDLGGLFGLTTAGTGALARMGVNFNDAATIGTNHKNDGKGKTKRDGSLAATVSCVVTEVLANGNLRIEGRKDITVNDENQFIILSGVVRPEDIASDNSLSSQQIADARIEYSGEGVLNDQQKPGWLNELFANIRIF